MHGSSGFGLTTTGSTLPDAGWSGVLVTQSNAPHANGAATRFQIGDSGTVDLPGGFEVGLTGNAAVTGSGRVSTHADLQLRTEGGTRLGGSLSTDGGAVTRQVYIGQQISDTAEISARGIWADGAQSPELRIRLDDRNFRGEAYLGEDSGFAATFRTSF